MRIKHLYYYALYLLHIGILEKLSSMEASQQSRSMRLRRIYSTKTKPSWLISLIMMIPGKFIIQGRRVIMKVSWVTQNKRIWRATIVTRRGTFDLSVGFERRNNKMLMSLNWLEEMKNSATFCLLQIDQLVTKIDRLLTLESLRVSFFLLCLKSLLCFIAPQAIYKES